MTDSELIAALGGPAKAAVFWEVTPQAVSQWKEKGIPRARRMYLRVMRPDLFPKQEPAKDVA